MVSAALRLPPFGVVSAALRLPALGLVSAALRLPPFGVVSAAFYVFFFFSFFIKGSILNSHVVNLFPRCFFIKIFCEIHWEFLLNPRSSPPAFVLWLSGAPSWGSRVAIGRGFACSPVRRRPAHTELILGVSRLCVS